MFKVFLDANVYFSGIMNPEGGSGYVLKLASGERFFHIATSQYVIGEASRNILTKLSSEHLADFKRLLHLCDPEFYASRYDIGRDSNAARIINTKDLPVLQAAVESSSEYLITLDRKHFFTSDVIRYASGEGMAIVTPKDFLEFVIKRIG